MIIRIVIYIVKEGINNNIFINIIEVINPEEIWEKLQTLWFKVG